MIVEILRNILLFILVYFIGIGIGFVLGYFKAIDNPNLFDLRQLEIEVKHALIEGKEFHIQKTGIKITPLKDGSGIIRIKTQEK